MVIKETIQFEKNLYDLINNCGLPVDTAFYVLKSVYLDFEKTLLECVKNEDQTYSQEKQVYQIDDREKGENNNE